VHAQQAGRRGVIPSDLLERPGDGLPLGLVNGLLGRNWLLSPFL
jgi:hypothetical protein